MITDLASFGHYGESLGALSPAGRPQVEPPVSAELVAQLEAMGFSRNKAVRALHATGTDSMEQAVNWIVEHGEDADVDTPLLLPKVGEPHLYGPSGS